MSTTITTPYTNRDPSATGTQKRSVNDKIRNLFPGSSKLMALVASGEVKKGEFAKGKGLLTKKSCDHRRYEFFVYTPPAVSYAVSSVAGANITMDSVDGLTLKRTFVNATNMDVGRISSINVTTKVITVTGINDASFTASAGDQLLVMAPAYEEGSSNPYRTSKDDDNQYNVMQLIRSPVAISASAKDSPHFGGDFFGRMKEKDMIQLNRILENTFLFGERASTTTTDLTADTTLGDSFGTMRGYWNWAQKSFSCGGAMSPEKWMTGLDQGLSDTISDGQKLVFLTGSKVVGDMNLWAEDKWMLQKEGSYSKYGVKTSVFSTGKHDIEVMRHNAFDQRGFEGKGLIICPDDMEYVYKTGRDLQPRKGIQDNSTDGYEDEIFGELTCSELTGGLHCCKVTDWFTN
jgi:hypothetical protein